MSEPLTKDKIVEGVVVAAEFNAASIVYLERKQPPELEKEVFKLGQIKYFKAVDVVSAVRLLREKIEKIKNQIKSDEGELFDNLCELSQGRVIGMQHTLDAIDEVFGGVEK